MVSTLFEIQRSELVAYALRLIQAQVSTLLEILLRCNAGLVEARRRSVSTFLEILHVLWEVAERGFEVEMFQPFLRFYVKIKEGSARLIDGRLVSTLLEILHVNRPMVDKTQKSIVSTLLEILPEMLWLQGGSAKDVVSTLLEIQPRETTTTPPPDQPPTVSTLLEIQQRPALPS